MRYSLIPIFGTDFPDSCLKPNEKGYGELKLDDLDSFEKRDLPAPIPPVSPPIEQMVQQPQQQHHQFKQNDKAAAISSFQQMGSLLPLPQNYDNSAAAMNSKTVLHPILLKHQLFITFLIQPVPEARHHHRRRHHYRLWRRKDSFKCV